MTATLIDNPPDRIAQRCTENFGQDRVQMAIGEHYRIADELQRVVLLPRSTDEISEMLRFAESEKMSVIPAGAGTWLEMGNKPVQAHIIISTAQMNRVIEYEPADLTCTVEAGCPLDSFNHLATEHLQRIPLDPFGDARSTLGAIVATGSHGPLRCGFGTPRDQVIGMQIIHANGQATRAGGKVVKNVAGYDLCKLYTGSFGTLGIISELSFRMRALPETEGTLFFYSTDVQGLCRVAARIRESDVQPAAMELFTWQVNEQEAGHKETRFTLALRFINEPEAIKAQMAEAVRLSDHCPHAVPNETEARTFWKDYLAQECDSQWQIVLRLSVLPSHMAEVLAEAASTIPEATLRIHAGNGVIRVFARAEVMEEFRRRERPLRLVELRQYAKSKGGEMMILRLPDPLSEQLDAWGDPGPTAHLMRALKGKFDPQSRLNPGRFVTGI
jgi:glycolate oxidase FAD binding subunit